MSNDLTITNVRPMAGPLASIHIVDGRIASIGAGSNQAGGDRRRRRHRARRTGRGAHPSRQDPVGHGLAQASGRPAADRQDRQRARAEEDARHRSGAAVGAPDRAVGRAWHHPHPQPCRRRHRGRPCRHRRRDGDARALSRPGSTSRSSRSRNPACWCVPARVELLDRGAGDGRRGGRRPRSLRHRSRSEGPCRPGVRAGAEATAGRSTSTCTSRARWAPSRWS